MLFEHTFDDLDDVALVAGIETCEREQNAAAARKLALVAQFTARRAADPEDEVLRWAADDWAAAAAEVGAALNVGPWVAAKWMRVAQEVGERLPRVQEMFAAGWLSPQVVSTLTWATHLVTDEQVLAIVDAQLAARAREFGPMSVDGVKNCVASVLEKYDPAAVRRSREASRDRDVRFGKPDDVTGTGLDFGAGEHRRCGGLSEAHCACGGRGVWAGSAHGRAAACRCIRGDRGRG
ncbi:DUF222 domain-containing protein [Mycolicibacterium goodii]|uniref:DUF222 domain-containing protein n=1 Tax=Mycolicibacterium goodii TaxID=134601 RepID=UPI0027DF0D87|nr:DUF222 domain-containing protein [Mycolicibacterium goodii]